jgi:hypothetical protein
VVHRIDSLGQEHTRGPFGDDSGESRFSARSFSSTDAMFMRCAEVCRGVLTLSPSSRASGPNED